MRRRTKFRQKYKVDCGMTAPRHACVFYIIGSIFYTFCAVLKTSLMPTQQHVNKTLQTMGTKQYFISGLFLKRTGSTDKIHVVDGSCTLYLSSSIGSDHHILAASHETRNHQPRPRTKLTSLYLHAKS